MKPARNDTTVALCGASGFIGGHLSRRLRAEGFRVVPLSRELLAEGRERQLVGVLEPCDALINVAGTSIAHRWTHGYKNSLYQSRTGVVRHLVEAMDRCPRLRVFFSASAVGYYASQGCHDEETGLRGDDFLAHLCADWEAAARRAPSRVRTLIGRFGMALAADGGLFRRFSLPARCGAGIYFGNGRQPFSWIDVEDLCRAVVFLLGSELSGVFNLTAPERISQREAVRCIARHYAAPLLLPVPALALRMTWGEAADLLLEGQCAPPARLLQAGFEFLSPDLSRFLKRIS